jgi:CDP-glucose 4,6-dehydratase
MGTLNILESCKFATNLIATLIITTDKVYKNKKKLTGYVETDELGGWDPYSASKAAADIATQSWVKSFGTTPVGIARAGNVIGGGDTAKDRLIPDLLRGVKNNQATVIRNPNAIRPWQHVLDCLNGYMKLIEHMVRVGGGGEWNFGPNIDEKHTVAEVLQKCSLILGKEKLFWVPDEVENFRETNFLLLNSEKARSLLKWEQVLNFDMALDWTLNWTINQEPTWNKMINQLNLFEKMKEKDL